MAIKGLYTAGIALNKGICMAKNIKYEDLKPLFKQVYGLDFEYNPKNEEGRVYRLFGSKDTIETLARLMECTSYKKGDRHLIAFPTPAALIKAHEKMLTVLDAYTKKIEQEGLKIVTREDRAPHQLPFRLCAAKTEEARKIHVLNEELNNAGINTKISESPKDGVFIGAEDYVSFLKIMEKAYAHLSNKVERNEVELPPIGKDGRS
jgi:hypothetical protein